MNKPFLLLSILLFLSCSKEDNTDSNILIDTEGNHYKTIRIGDQTWMAENLKTTKYNDNTAIEKGTNNWSSTEGRYQWASTADLNNVIPETLPHDYYGIIYNFASVQTGKLAPKGWRIPTKSDWNQLIAYLKNNGFENREGHALKSKSGWSSNGSGTDSFNFNALPAGYVDIFGTPKVDGFVANWMSTSQNNAFSYISVGIIFDQHTISMSDAVLHFGNSVRCIKNN